MGPGTGSFNADLNNCTVLGTLTANIVDPTTLSLSGNLSVAGTSTLHATAATQLTLASTSPLQSYVAPTAWTPNVFFGGASVGIVYSTQAGTVLKIGQVVFYTFNIVMSAVGSSTGTMTIGTLPYTALSGSVYLTPCASNAALTGLASGYTQLTAQLDPTLTSAGFTILASSTQSTAGQVLLKSNVANNISFQASGWYLTGTV